MDNLKLLLGKLKEAEEYEHASKIIEFDMETKTPTKGLKAQGELQSLLANKAYEITHSKEFVDCVVALHKELDSLETEAKVLVSKLYKDIERDTINKWMFENVWKDADKLDSSDWIKQITTRELTSKDFLEYIENKYGMLYGL